MPAQRINVVAPRCRRAGARMTTALSVLVLFGFGVVGPATAFAVRHVQSVGRYYGALSRDPLSN
jgi:hypothetical protein